MSSRWPAEPRWVGDFPRFPSLGSRPGLYPEDQRSKIRLFSVFSSSDSCVSGDFTIMLHVGCGANGSTQDPVDWRPQQIVVIVVM